MHAFPVCSRPLLGRAPILFGSLMLFVFAAAAADPPLGSLTPDTVNQWVEIMRTSHPALGAARERSRAASLNAAGIRRIADPKALVGGAVYSAQGMDPSEEGNLVYGVEQTLPILGKETAARRKAEAQAGVESARVDVVFQESRRDLTLALFAAGLALRTVQLGQEDTDALRTSLAAAEARYGSAAGSSVDVLRLQSELARRVAEVRNSEQALASAQAGVNRWLGRAPDSTLPALSLPDPAAPLSKTPELVRIALRSEAGLRVLDRERSVAESSLVASRRQRRPDLGVGITGRQYSGDGAFRQGQFTLSVSLPWFNRDRYRRDIQRDEAQIEAVRLDTGSRELALREEIFRLSNTIGAARRTVLSYREEILPQTEAAYSAALNAWMSGRGMLTDVLDTRRARLLARLEEARAIAEQWSALGELVLCCGLEDLDSLFQIEATSADAPSLAAPRG